MPKPPPLVTIAIPYLNEAGFIEACLQSVRAQTYPRDQTQILVADGGSTDGTRDILACLAAEDSRIRVIENTGFVDTVFLGAYRRKVFDRICPWDRGAARTRTPS